MVRKRHDNLASPVSARAGALSFFPGVENISRW